MIIKTWSTPSLCVLTRRGTSLLIISCTVFDSDELLEKLTRYFRLNVRATCWFISINTPPSEGTSSDFLGFFDGWPFYTQMK